MAAARNGKYRGGRRPFGYESDGVTVCLEEAAAVLDASQRVVHGESLSSIAREWNVRGILSSMGRPWTSISLRGVLLRARNAGIISHHGNEVGRANWPTIVPEEIWRAVRAVLRDPARRLSHSTEARWLGSGLFQCGVCDDGTIVRAATSASGKQTYRCKASAHLARAAEPVDELVTIVALARLSRPDARLLLRTAPSEDIEALSTETEALRIRLDELAGLFAEGAVTGSQLAEGTAKIRQRLAELTSRMAGAAAGSPLAGFADAADVAAAWEAASVSRRKAVIDVLMVVTLLAPGRGARVFDPDTVGIDWRCSD